IVLAQMFAPALARSEAYLANTMLLLGVLGLFSLSHVSLAEAQAGKAGKKNDGYSQVIQDAINEFEAGNYGEARVLFEQGHVLRPSARTLRGMGMASFELKEYVRSEQELNAALVDLRQPLTAAQRKEAVALLLRLERYIGKLDVRTVPVNATVTLDGRAISGETKVDLGRHELTAQAPGHRTLTREISVEGGKTQLVELTLPAVQEEVSAPAPEPTPAPAAALSGRAAPAPSDTDTHTASDSGVLGKWWFWTALGVVAAGGVTAAVVLTSKSSTEPPVPGNTGAAVQVLRWTP
ncbi:MAG TPA: PEGA domain-containing protein, partial [Polyangiales bacterium]|nr:PEGA domain-containing protein [Polyangiales bacterium]